MLVTYAFEPDATGSDDTSRFQALSAAKTRQVPSEPFCVIDA
jgi:hypothetical protein